MKHPQALIVMLGIMTAAFALAIWAGSLWGALGVLAGGLALAFVVATAWLWSPRSGIGRGKQPSKDAFSRLP